MAIVAGVDFGTLSVRVSIFDSARGVLGSGAAEYPLRRKKDDPDFATQSHAAQMNAFVEATVRAFDSAGVAGERIEAIAAATTGSTVVPVGAGLEPLDDYYMWCDHRAWREAALLTETARRMKLAALDWCGGVYPPEGGFAKTLHWLRNHPEKRSELVAVVEHADMFPATLCGISDIDQLPRSMGAAGQKWMWNAGLGGFPPCEYLAAVDPLLAGIRERLRGRFAKSGEVAGRLSPEWARRIGVRAGIPVSVGGIDGYWDAIGAGIREGDVAAIPGTSVPVMALARAARPIPGTCGAAYAAAHPEMYLIEAGLGAGGDIWEAIAGRAGTSVAALSRGLERYRAGQTGLLRFLWDNGDRSVLINSNLGGMTIGWNLNHTAQDELFAAIEGTALHTRIILERLEEYGVPVRRLILGGRVARRIAVLNQVFADVLGKPVLFPVEEMTGLGAAIFAFLAAGTFGSVEDAQQALCSSYRTVEPDAASVKVYEELSALYRKLYFGFGQESAGAVSVGDVLPTLRRIGAAGRDRV